MDKFTLDKLESQDWKSIIVKLTAEVRFRLFTLKDKKMLEGKTPYDIAIEAIEKLYTGERKWDFEKDPDILKFLKYNVIKSMTNNLFETINRKSIVFIKNNEDFNEDIEYDFFRKFGIEDELERELYAKELLDDIEKELKNEDEWQIFNYRLDGLKNSEISNELGIPIKEVENIMKRIKRKLIDIKNELNYKTKAKSI